MLQMSTDGARAIQPSEPIPDRATWRPLGVEPGKGAEWFYLFELHGRPVKIRSTLITMPATLLAIDPNADRWRMMFPHPHSRARFDHLKAGGWLVRECWAAQIRAEEAAKAAHPPVPEPTEVQT